jgi:hypothetical protein
MPDYRTLKAKVQELAQRQWDQAGIEERVSALARDGILKVPLNRDEILASKQQILERVQRRGEEYEFLSHS